MSNIYAIQGPPGSGKSTFGLTFPGKVFIFDLEYGAHRATWRVDESKYTLFRLTPDINKMMMVKGDLILGERESWDIITKKYVEILNDSEHTAIVFDTHFKLWRMDHRAELQRKQELQLTKGSSENDIRETLQPIEYGTPNTQMEALLDVSRIYNKDLILVNHEKDIYITTIVKGVQQSVPSGQKEMEGWSKTADQADWQLLTSMTEAVGDKSQVFHMKILKSPQGAHLVGRSFEDASYVKLHTLAKALREKGNGS